MVTERLQAIQQARARLEQRQREAELERGRDPDEPPRDGRYKRPFGVPEDKAQENFTDPDSRIMKRSGGGFNASYNAQTAVDEHANIVITAELTNVGSDAAELADQERAGLQAVQHARAAPRHCGVEARLRGAKPAKNVQPAAQLRTLRASASKRRSRATHHKDRDGGGSCSEIKEERAARGKAGDIRGMSHPRPGPGRATALCRPGS